MGLAPVHQRLAELRAIEKKRPLTDDEQTEMNHCLDANVYLCWEHAKWENQFSIAFELMDKDWMHECSAKLDELEYTKKPGREATD